MSSIIQDMTSFFYSKRKDVMIPQNLVNQIIQQFIPSEATKKDIRTRRLGNGTTQ